MRSYQLKDYQNFCWSVKDINSEMCNLLSKAQRNNIYWRTFFHSFKTAISVSLLQIVKYSSDYKTNEVTCRDPEEVLKNVADLVAQPNVQLFVATPSKPYNMWVVYFEYQCGIWIILGNNHKNRKSVKKNSHNSKKVANHKQAFLKEKLGENDSTKYAIRVQKMRKEKYQGT